MRKQYRTKTYYWRTVNSNTLSFNIVVVHGKARYGLTTADLIAIASKQTKTSHDEAAYYYELT